MPSCPRSPRALTLWSALALSVVSPLEAKADARCGGVSLPEHAQAFGLPLVRNGMGIRRASFLNVHVYVAGLYLEQRTASAAQALDPERAKLITLRFVRNVDRKEMVDALHEAIEKNAGTATYNASRAHMDSFARHLPALREGTELTLAYRQGHGLETIADGQVRAVEPDDGFANLIFRAWLGPHPPDKDLKVGLLGGECE